MDTISLDVTFEAETLHERNALANSLDEYLIATMIRIETDLKRENSNTMDFGATLAIIIGTSAATALAQGIGDWIKQKNNAKITVKLGDKILNLDGVKPGEVKSIISEFINSNG